MPLSVLLKNQIPILLITLQERKLCSPGAGNTILETCGGDYWLFICQFILPKLETKT
jgi:hypothetical protein